MEHIKEKMREAEGRHFHRDMPEKISVGLRAKGEQACKSPRDESRKSNCDHECDHHRLQ